MLRCTQKISDFSNAWDEIQAMCEVRAENMQKSGMLIAALTVWGTPAHSRGELQQAQLNQSRTQLIVHPEVRYPDSL